MGPGLNSDGTPMEAVGRAVMKFEDRPVEVLSGRVTMMDDGTMVDMERSDDTIVIRDVATGKVEMVSPEAILSYEEYDAEMVVDNSVDNSEGVYNQTDLRPEYGSGSIVFKDTDGKEKRGWLMGGFITEANYDEMGTTPDNIGKYEYYVEGDRKRMHYATDEELDGMVTEYVPDEPQEPVVPKDSQGNELAVGDEIVLSAGRTGVVSEIKPDGSVSVDHNGETVTYDEQFGDITATGLRKVVQTPPVEEAHATPTETPAEPITPTPEPTPAPAQTTEGVALPNGITAVGSINVPQQDGSTRTFTVGKNAEGENVVLDESGFLWGHDGNGANMQPHRPGSNVPIWTDKQIAQFGAVETTNEQPTTVPNPAENAVPVVENGPEAVSKVEATPLERIPRDEKGNPIFEQAESPEHGWDALVELRKGDTKKAQGIADTMVDEAKKAHDKAQRLKPKGKTVMEISESQDQIEAQQAAAAANYDFWQRVAAVERGRQEAIRRQQEAEARQRAIERAEAEKEARAAAEEQARIERGAGASDDSRGTGGQAISRSGDEGVREIQRPLTEREAEELLSRMEANVEQAKEIELTPENWFAMFGESGIVKTPIGDVKMGENQLGKLILKKRTEYFGMIHPTLTNPDVIVEKSAPADDAERDTKYLFIKTFIKPDGSRIVHFESITVQKDGMEVSISSHEAEAKSIKKEMQNGKILHLSDKLSPDSDGYLTEAPNGPEGPDLVPTSDKVSSDGKDTQSLTDKQISSSTSSEAAKPMTGEESSLQLTDDKDAELERTSVQASVQAASAEVDQNPTEAQKEAGNYKKGHVKVDGFDITIEQPKGSIRRGTDENGKQWEQEMHTTYGYIRGTEGVDGDHIDVFLSDNPEKGDVFVVDQVRLGGIFDEHKVMLGFNDKDAAMSAYLANYDETWAQNHPGLRISETNLEDFDKWIKSSHRKTKPFADYSNVSKVTDNAPTEQSATVISGNGYKVESKTYTNKQGKTLDTYLVTFDRDFSKEEMSALRAKAKALKGWYDRETKGWMLRSEADAKAFADEVATKAEDELADQAPLSMADMGKPAVKKVDLPRVADDLRKKGEAKLSDHAESVGDVGNERINQAIGKTFKSGNGNTMKILSYEGEGIYRVEYNGERSVQTIVSLLPWLDDVEVTSEQPKPKKRSKWISDEDAAEFDVLRNNLRSHLGAEDNIVQEDAAWYGHKKSQSKSRLDLTTPPAYAEVTSSSSKGSAKLRKISENLISLRQKLTGQTAYKGALTEFASAIYADGQGYSTIISANGNEAHIRISNHNAYAENFAKRGHKEDNVSVVIKSRHTPNTFRPHPEVELTEYVYTKEAIKADGNMLSQVAESLRRMIETGEYVDLSGKAIVNLSPEADVAQENAPTYGKPQPKQMDSEVLRMGTRMTYLMMKGGLRSFADYCEAMKDELPDIFDDIRPHLKSLYAAAQNMEEVIDLGWDEEMDDRKTVKAFDVYNFDKPGAKDIIETAQHITQEETSQQQTEQIIQSLKDQRNEQRKQEADKTSADTETIIDKAEVTASKVESELADARTEEDAERLNESLDKEIEEVNKQLALLGYYEADQVDKDFNEAYGYMRNAERKATQDAHRLATQLAAQGKPRRVILTRYDKPVRIVPYKEVARMIAEQLDGTGIEIPFNVVTPQVRAELERLGVGISETATGTAAEGAEYGKAEYITDQEIERLNARHEAMRQTSEEAKQSHAEAMAGKFNTPVRVVRDESDLSGYSDNIRKRIMKSKGMYDPRTGEVVVVLPNHEDVEDVAETMLHEVVAHKGLREMVGEENYDAFCDEVYDHLKDDLKEEVDRETTRRFMDEPEKGHEQARRKAVDEMFGRMAEKDFEDFSKAERSIWAKLKQKMLEAINKFLGTLKLPKWVKLGDHELRYMLWRSHERLRSGGDYVDMARDAAKRSELGLDDSGPMRESREMQELRRVNDRFNSQLEMQIDGKLSEGHVYQMGKPGAVLRSTGIPNLPIELCAKRLLEKATKFGHDFDLSEVRDLPSALQAPVAIFAYGDPTKAQNIILQLVSGEKNFIVGLSLNPTVGGRKLEINSVRNVFPKDNAEWIKWITDGKLLYVDKEKIQPILGQLQTIPADVTRIGLDLDSVAKVINNFENPVIETSESDLRFRDSETGDIWKDRSVGLEERITNAAIRLSNNQSGDMTLRNDAMRAIGGNLTSLRRAMAAQKRFDQSTVKRVADLARILMQNGYLSGMTSGEMQRGVMRRSSRRNSIHRYELLRTRMN